MNENKCQFYETILNSNVKIKCNDGSTIHGKTLSIDGYLNIALEAVSVFEYGVQDPIFQTTAFVRGSNIEYIAIEY